MKKKRSSYLCVCVFVRDGVNVKCFNLYSELGYRENMEKSDNVSIFKNYLWEKTIPNHVLKSKLTHIIEASADFLVCLLNKCIFKLFIKFYLQARLFIENILVISAETQKKNNNIIIEYLNTYAVAKIIFFYSCMLLMWYLRVRGGGGSQQNHLTCRIRFLQIHFDWWQL